MSINPVLTTDVSSGELIPLPKQGETFVLKRKDIIFEVKLPGGKGKLKAKGIFYLTSQRMVFVAHEKKNREDFGAFEAPLSLIKKQSFEQPIFGANYLELHVDTGENDTMCGICVTYFSFYSGGCGTFLPIFSRIMKELRNRPGSLDAAISEIHQTNTAYVDQSDPSVLYVVQPQAQRPPAMIPVIADPVVSGSQVGPSSSNFPPPNTTQMPEYHGTVPVVTGVPVRRR